MALLKRSRGWQGVGLILLTCLCGCSSAGDLTSVAASLVEIQREANITRSALSGPWNGEIRSPDGVGRQAIVLIFSQGEGFALDGSFLIGEDIRLGGGVSQDSLALVNGVFLEGEIRFNIAKIQTGALILVDGKPVQFTGILTENSFMSGKVSAGSTEIGIWEAFAATTPPGL